MPARHLYGPQHVPDTLEPAGRWRDSAACAQLNRPDAMYPAPTDVRALGNARAICATCPVQEACLEDALAEEGGRSKDNRYGIRAGTTPYQRFSIYQRERPSAQERKQRTASGDARALPCGTRAAALRHKRFDEELDEACLDAYDEYLRKKNGKAKARRAAQKQAA